MKIRPIFKTIDIFSFIQFLSRQTNYIIKFFLLKVLYLVCEAHIPQMETELEDQEENIQGVDQLLQVVDRYLNIQELTPEILHEFVERILVHERSEGRKKKGLGRFLF